ncbi:solute carrier family 15 member 1-like [Branchiostoma lanceolatum]|uniref:solute carrier family 15 member 1-like n=1 Tax=Branchiostoma lanceolatum TaxID=7740 RepID=UPI0034539841
MTSNGVEKGLSDSSDGSNGSNGGSLKKPNNSKHATPESSLLKGPPPGEEPGGSGIKNFFTRNGQFPGCVYFIVGNEFCERFSYYGMRAVLILYLTQFLGFDDDVGTGLYHAFVMLCYFSPLLGAMVADGWLGRYKVILYVSLFYAAGNIIMAITALPPLGAPERAGPLIGLLVIGFGTGGIKPCVSAFGGDQFSDDQDRMRQLYFSMFYFSINAGSLLSLFLTPILRSDVQCYGGDCYPLAFGVPAVLMLAAVLIFVAGSSLYKRIPPSGNITGLVFRTVGSALKNRITSKNGEKKEHWLDWASDNYERDLVEDVKKVFHVIVLYLPLPVFWALFDQQGSRWTLQAEKMDGSLGPLGRLKPDQMQFVNALMILVFIPIFEGIIYPLFAKCNLLVKPLQRMGAGMLLAAAAFVIAGFIELRLEGAELVAPPVDKADLRIINVSPCDLAVQGQNNFNLTIGFAQTSGYQRLDAGSQDLTFTCEGFPDLSSTVNLKSQSTHTVTVGVQNGVLKDIQISDVPKRPTAAISKVRFVYMLNEVLENNASIILEGSKKYTLSGVEEYSATNLTDIEPGSYRVLVPHNDSSHEEVAQELVVNTGGVYTAILMLNNTQSTLATFQDVSPNDLSMLWQIPQYVVITAGEVMFSITGLEFSFSQSPESMRSVLQALWLLTVAFGNLITFIIANLNLFPEQSSEFFFFAALMVAVDIIFVILAVRYKYVTPARSREDDKVAIVRDSEGTAMAMSATDVDSD